MGTLDEKYRGKKVHSWALWSKVKAVLTGQWKRMRNLQELRDYFHDDSENLSSEAFLSELVVGSDCNNNLGKRKVALQVGKIFQLC
jgi:hypothetical protein